MHEANVVRLDRRGKRCVCAAEQIWWHQRATCKKIDIVKIRGGLKSQGMQVGGAINKQTPPSPPRIKNAAVMHVGSNCIGAVSGWRLIREERAGCEHVRTQVTLLHFRWRF
jgi:hypothetical protein